MRAPTPPSRPAPAPVPPWHRPWLLALLLALGTLALYWPALRCGFINMDDPEYVTANPRVQAGLTWATVSWFFTHPVIANWHPLTMLSHALDCQLFGLQPWGPHLVNALFHAANAALVFALLRRLTGATGRSFAVAALFAVHPLHVESVAWVSERKDVLSAFFFLLALLAYVQYANGRWELGVRRGLDWAMLPSPISHLPSPICHLPSAICHLPSPICHLPSAICHLPSPICYLLSLFFFALGLLCKPMVVTLPFVLLLLDCWPLRRIYDFRSMPSPSPGAVEVAGESVAGDNRKSSIINHKSLPFLLLEKLPFFALAAAACWITVVVQSAGGSVVAGISLPLGDRVGNALIAYCRYLGKLFWPVDLANYYPHPGHWPLAPVLLAGALLLALSALVFLNRRRWPFLLMGWLWFVGMLVPVIGLKQAGWQSMADRYAYLPSLGIFVLVVWGAAELARVRGGDGASRPPSPLASSASRRLNSRFRFPLSCFSAAGAAAILCCSALTHRQLGYWQNSETLFRHTLAVTGDNNYFARENLGLTLMDQGRLDEAIAQFSQVLRYSPTHYNLGLALALKGDNAAAVREFSEAVRVSPGQVDAHYNLAIALLKTGAAAAAIAEFQEVVRLQPDHVEARYNLGTQLGMAGHLDDAIVQLAAAVRLKPDYVGARHNLALALLNTGQTDAAIAQLQAIVSLRPDDPEARQQLAQVQALKSAPPAP